MSASFWSAGRRAAAGRRSWNTLAPRAHGLNVLAAAGEHGEQEFPFALARRLLEPDEVASTDRYGLQLELNRVLAAKTPALIVIDDLQWCDPDSLRWLAFAARRLRRTGLALVAASDCADDRIPRRDVLRLRPFSRPRGRNALARRARARRRRPLRRRVPSRDRRPAAAGARGRRHGSPEPRARDGRRRAVGRFGGPARRRALPRAPPGHAAARGPGARGRRCPARRPGRPHEAAALAGLGADAAAAASDRLQHAGLLEGWTIAPPLLARAFYDALPPARRARMHAHAARFGSAERHLLYSEPSADPWVVDMLRRAAEQALDRGSPARRPGSYAARSGRACWTRGRR